MVRDGRTHRSFALVALLALVAALVLASRPALARSYTMDEVVIDAAVDADGTLSVREEREFDFDGSFNGVYWNIPTGSYQGRAIETAVTGVGEVIDGDYVAYEQSDSGANHTYELIEGPNYLQVKVYTAHKDDRARVVISYSDANLATRYADTAELYWKFVSDGWDEESKNVTCTIHLPVPDGATVIGGENVRAWGHGPLDATVAFVGDDVVFRVPGVGTSEFAEARIAFPGEWLSGVAPTDVAALDEILSEEQAWADEANAQRNAARALVFGCTAAGVGVPVLALALAIFRRRKYQQAHRPLFDDEYFRDVPSDDHPAVLGILYHGGTPESEDLTASLMRLSDMGVIRLEPTRLTVRKAFGREKTMDDYRIVRTGREVVASGSEGSHDIDARTVDFLFCDLAPLARRGKYVGEAAEAGDDVLYFSEIEQVAKANPERYHDAYEGWRDKVETVCGRRRFFVEEQGTGRGLMTFMGFLSIVAGCVAAVFLFLAGAYVQFAVTLVAGIACGVIAFVLAAKNVALSHEAVELRAQLKALRRWLKDFTRLGEAVPNDVVLWNRLLVMATVLGVAKEVIDQLKMAAPQILEDDYLMPVYGWYLYDARRPMPASAFNEAASSAHSVSTAALAASSDSDGGGGGGGFSGGGGGGFGGGGGGGAF